MEVGCYMCGEPCTGRLVNDPDSPSIPLCDASRCKNSIATIMEVNRDMEKWLERVREKLHAEQGNQYTPDKS